MRMRQRRHKAPSGAFFYGRSLAPAIVGYKGGGSVSSPKESPDSLHSTQYARIIDIVSEGEIYGPVHGLAGMLQDVYLDGTPVANADGTLNFQNVQVDFRPGTQFQDPLPGFPAAENTFALGVELTSGQAWVRTYTNVQLSAARITLAVAGLSKSQTDGDITGYRVEYAIDLSTDGGPYQQVLSSAFDGKTTQRYSRSHRIDFPRATSGWSIRVRRITPNANSNTIADRTFIDATTEIIDGKLRYPMSAVFGIKIDASQFPTIPTRAYHLRGRILRVPSNYDPESRTYVGVWDGTFKYAYSNNPAWVFYDILTNDRYGLGDSIPAGWTDKWNLYQIGRYCDEMVPDGFGGMEPRYTCNLYLQSAADAWRVVQDMASVFRGMAYYATGAVYASADLPGDAVYTFSSADVVDGRFTYAGSALRTRYNVALVSWNDPSDMGRQKVEYVEDQEGIARYGIRQIETTAIGCTSRGQAHRVGKWLLLTSKVETRSVTFSVGLAACRVRPGSIIKVADQHLAGRRLGGRIQSATSTTVTLDAPIAVRPGDRITVNLPSGVSESRTVSAAADQTITLDRTDITLDSTDITLDMLGLPGSVIQVTVTAPFSEVPQAESNWAIESEELSAQLYRVISIARKDELTADISAIQHVPSKYDNVDFGTRLEMPPISVVPPTVQPPPTNVTVSEYSVISQGVSSQTAVFEWTAAPNAVAYEVQWKRDNSDWVTAGRTGTTRLEVPNIYAGAYLGRVRAVNAAGVTSIWANSVETNLAGILAPPPVVTNLTTTTQIFAIGLKWGFPQVPSIIEKTEIWYGTTADRATAIKLGDFAFPQDSHTMFGLAAGAELWFWARLVDKNGQVGEFFPAGGGVRGTASADATPILQYLLGQITETQLYAQLRQKIDSGANAAVLVQQMVSEIAALYTIKVQLTANGIPYWAGIGVGAENNNGIITTQILLAAQRVAVLDESSGTTSAPFVIQGGQVFINQAFIGSIDAGKITTGTMDAQRIHTQSLIAVLANIQTAYIVNAHIINAQVDTLKIAGQSVSVTAATSYNLTYGQSSGSSTASVSIFIPQGGVLLVQLAVDSATGAGLDYNQVAVTVTSNFGWSKNFAANQLGELAFHGASLVLPAAVYVSGSVGPGTYTVTLNFNRPGNQQRTASGSLAITGVMR